MRQIPLFLEDPKTAVGASSQTLVSPGARAIEAESFPFERFSDIAEVESFRKEIYRPPYHIHKWWAQRLGSVFRAIVLGAFAPAEEPLAELFYRPIDLGDVVVFDPFMGSGTTIGETLKLGARAIGRDINPVAYNLVRTALALPSRQELLDAYRDIERDLGAVIRSYYQGRLADGTMADVLYYFWVMQVPCPGCTNLVDLFSSYVFARHAYPKRYPDAQVLCPSCGAVNVARYDSTSLDCSSCAAHFDPSSGPARGVTATCPGCAHRFAIATAVRALGRPPGYRLYAKLVLTSSGRKQYLGADDWDRELSARAEVELGQRAGAYPIVRIAPGHNTNQVLKYGYTHWHQMFDARQLLCLSLLGERVRALKDERLRDVFLCLFSGVLEFNNLFASFKGEGTGAVRHMFSHHILKPERTPLEANLWGTPKSSGAFSTLFERRILRALDYCENPFELRLVVDSETRRSGGEKVFGLSRPLFAEAAATHADFRSEKRSLYLSCGDSSKTDIPSSSVDAVITDPPFFDNVHYSELADFFHVWQRHLRAESPISETSTTRSDREVQAQDGEVFASRLSAVWRECHRVLKDDGLLVFSYHHSRAEGWRCVLGSLTEAGFVVVRTHPIKAEMSGATPKAQAREPIDLDILIVCRKRESWPDGAGGDSAAALGRAAGAAKAQLARLRRSGRSVSRNDIRIIVMAQLIGELSRSGSTDDALPRFDVLESGAETLIERAHQENLQ
jgi:adenine-specific DNA methylase